MSAFQQMGDPVIHDAILVSKDSLLVVYGNNVETKFEEYELNGTKLTLRRSTTCFQVPGLPGGKIEHAFLNGDSDTNVLVSFLDNTGMTNKAVWTKEAGWTLTTNNNKWLFHNFRK